MVTCHDDSSPRKDAARYPNPFGVADRPVHDALPGGHMDPAAQPIIALYELSHHILTLAAADLSDPDARTRSRGGTGPSIAWTVGHLCHHKLHVLELLGRPRQHSFAVTFQDAATDGQAYPPLTELVAGFSALH